MYPINDTLGRNQQDRFVHSYGGYNNDQPNGYDQLYIYIYNITHSQLGKIDFDL
jgi:hypothetical protein